VADPTFRAVTAITVTAGGSHAVTLPTGTAIGDITTFEIFGTGGVLTAPDATYKLQGTELSNSTVRVATFCKKWVTTPPANATFTSAAAGGTGGGAHTTQGSDLQVIPGAQAVLTTGSTSIVTGSVTTVRANCLLVASAVAVTVPCSYTNGTLTERSDPGDGGYFGDEIQAAAGASGTRTLTASLSTNAIAILVGIQSNPYVGAATTTQGLVSSTLAGNSRR
jgi:hypothetical protein